MSKLDLPRLIADKLDEPDDEHPRMFKPSPYQHRLAFDNLVYLAETGSNVTGVPRKNDRDFIGACIEPPSAMLGVTALALPVFEQYEAHTGKGPVNVAGDIDTTIYSLRKFVRMAAAGNPNILVSLFVPQNYVEHSTTAGADLRAQRDMFITRSAGLRFIGLARTQLRKLHKSGRKELVAKHGYDTDFAYHGLRALVQGIELMKQGVITFPVSEEDLAFLTYVRRGEFTEKHIKSEFESLDSQLAKAMHSSSLPESPDYARINDWLTSTYIAYWREKEFV